MGGNDDTQVQVGDWTARPLAGTLSRAGASVHLEPKTMDLLILLASRRGEVISRDDITAAIWPHVIVTDESIAHVISKLRRALNDSARSPRYIETVPKRGYRLMTAPDPVVGPPSQAPQSARWAVAAMVMGCCLIGVLAVFLLLNPASRTAPVETEKLRVLSQADDFYGQYTRAGNESAIELYTRVVAEDPVQARALSGLANALVQKGLRWPSRPDAFPVVYTTLRNAIDQGRTDTPEARQLFEQAAAYASQAASLAPRDAASYKAVGFARSAQHDYDGAVAAYVRALSLDPAAWGVMLNLSELYDMKGESDKATALLVRAYPLMPEHNRFQPELGALIGERYAQAGNVAEAEIWYRHALDSAPFDDRVTVDLARLLTNKGAVDEARALCQLHARRIGPLDNCRI